MDITVEVETGLAHRSRVRRRHLGLIGWTLRAIGLVTLLRGLAIPWFTEEPTVNVPEVFLGLYLLVSPEFLGLVYHLKAKRFGPRWTYTIRDDGVSVKSAVSSATADWAVVKKVEETSDHWYVRLHGGDMIGIPRKLLTSAQEEELRAFLASRAEAKS